jgi:nitroreductase
MKVQEAIHSRHSVRKFLPEPVPEETVLRILDAGRWAPSGMNNQPWRFIVITARNAIEMLSSMTKYSDTVFSAPLLIAVFLDQKAVYDRTKDIQGIGACIQNMWLAAQAEGLGVCWNGEILRKRGAVERNLGLTSQHELMALLCIGRPAAGEHNETRERHPLSSLILARV